MAANASAPRSLWLLPSIAGIVWFLMLFAMLSYWLAQGRPRLPSQNNPDIAYVSDIGAQELKPIFVGGSFITAITYAGTIISVHYVRYASYKSGLTHIRLRKSLSVVAVLSAFIASLALCTLSVCDPVNFLPIHMSALGTCFLGLGFCGVCTIFVYWDETFMRSQHWGLRKSCIANTNVWVIEFCLGQLFFNALSTGDFWAAGVSEWAVTFIGAVYIFTFVGYLRAPPGDSKEIDTEERQRLLSE